MTKVKNIKKTFHYLLNNQLQRKQLLLKRQRWMCRSRGGWWRQVASPAIESEWIFVSSLDTCWSLCVQIFLLLWDNNMGSKMTVPYGISWMERVQHKHTCENAARETHNRRGRPATSNWRFWWRGRREGIGRRAEKNRRLVSPSFTPCCLQSANSLLSSFPLSLALSFLEGKRRSSCHRETTGSACMKVSEQVMDSRQTWERGKMLQEMTVFFLPPDEND